MLDAFKTNGSSPPKLVRNPECAALSCASTPHAHRPRPDFFLADHGTIFLLQPITGRALTWVREHLPPDSPRFGAAVVVEHRFIADIVGGIRDDGLEVRS